jgi:hypothetical protein
MHQKDWVPRSEPPKDPASRSQQTTRASKLEQHHVHGKLDWDQAVNSMHARPLRAYWAEMEKNVNQEHNTIEDWNPSIFAVKANANDDLSWGQVMNGPHSEGFWQAWAA